jgi:hypothetical protein
MLNGKRSQAYTVRGLFLFCPKTAKAADWPPYVLSILSPELFNLNSPTSMEEIIPKLRGWINYFRLTEVKGIFDELDGWLRQKINMSPFPYYCVRTALHGNFFNILVDLNI